MSFSYPSQTDFYAAVPTLLGIFGGNFVLATDALALYTVQGYAMSQLIPGAAASAKFASHAQLAAQLQTGSNIDWFSLIQAVLAILATLHK